MADRSKPKRSVRKSAWAVMLFAGTIATGAPEFPPALVNSPSAPPAEHSDGPQALPASAAGETAAGDQRGVGDQVYGGTLPTLPPPVPEGPGEQVGEIPLRHSEQASGGEAGAGASPGGMAPNLPPLTPGQAAESEPSSLPDLHASDQHIVLLLDDGADAATVNLGAANPGTVMEFRVKGRVVSNVPWRLAYTASDFLSRAGKTFSISHLSYGGTDLEGFHPFRSAGDVYPLRPPTGDAGYSFEHVFVLTFPEDAEPGEYHAEIHYAALPVDQP